MKACFSHVGAAYKWSECSLVLLVDMQHLWEGAPLGLVSFDNCS
jgi:hypothetical protein